MSVGSVRVRQNDSMVKSEGNTLHRYMKYEVKKYFSRDNVGLKEVHPTHLIMLWCKKVFPWIFKMAGPGWWSFFDHHTTYEYISRCIDIGMRLQ